LSAQLEQSKLEHVTNEQDSDSDEDSEDDSEEEESSEDEEKEEEPSKMVPIVNPNEKKEEIILEPALENLKLEEGAKTETTTEEDEESSEEEDFIKRKVKQVLQKKNRQNAKRNSNKLRGREKSKDARDAIKNY
jgi:hypothetical protein